ncbi:MAG: hypothetical protein CVU88_02455 [Firmicutes bacterium HGW-Firmicutes-13]|nr:MAG: hypothetical protein CVU88_02455 [Firmicutes bacterium HGW-Firmicutes-13]
MRKQKRELLFPFESSLYFGGKVQQPAPIYALSLEEKEGILCPGVEICSQTNINSSFFKP